MYITHEDIEKIACYLGKYGIKDTDFPELLEGTGDEQLVIIADGANQRISIQKFFEIASGANKTSLIGVDITFNGKHYSNLDELLQAILKYIIENRKNIANNYKLIQAILKFLKDQFGFDPDIDIPTPPGGGDNPEDNPESRFSIYYTPSDDIPNGAKSVPHGGLQSATKEELSTYTYNDLFDKILFVDNDAHIEYNADNNRVTAKKELEVGSFYDPSAFTTVKAIATYGYPDGSKEWGLGNISASGVVSLGPTNTATALFTLSWTIKPALATNYGKETTKILEPQQVTKSGTLTGYYNYGWTSSNEIEVPTSYTILKTTSQLKDALIESTTNTSLVYVALPVALTLTDVKIKNGLSGAYESLGSINFEKVSTGISINALSTINKYNIWRINKANLNADGTITPNDQPIKITTA